MNVQDGLAHLSLTLPPSAEVGDLLEVHVEVHDETRSNPFLNVARLRVLAAQPTASGGPGIRRTRGAGPGGLLLQSAGIELPSIQAVYEPDWPTEKMDAYSALRVQNLGSNDAGAPTRYLFKVNMDNEFLRAERRSAPRAREVMDAQWRYGLVLLGLGLLRELPSESLPTQDAAPRLSDVFEEDRIAQASDSLAPVLLPMIRELGELELAGIEGGNDS